MKEGRGRQGRGGEQARNGELSAVAAQVPRTAPPGGLGVSEEPCGPSMRRGLCGGKRNSSVTRTGSENQRQRCQGHVAGAVYPRLGGLRFTSQTMRDHQRMFSREETGLKCSVEA